MSFSEYMQQALVEAMRFDIEERNLCDSLLENIDGEESRKDSCSPSSAHDSLAPESHLWVRRRLNELILGTISYS
jgi:hypothetical protein